MTHDFLDDEQRKRLAYADRAETLEERPTLDRRHEMDRCGACGHAQAFHAVGSGNGVPYGHGYCDDRHGDPCDCTGFQRQLADGTGRHSRDQLQLADALTRIDQLTAELAQREDRDARQDVVLDALRRLVRALPERMLYEFSPDSRRVLGAHANALAVLADNEGGHP